MSHTNMVEKAKSELCALVRAAYEKAVEDGVLKDAPDITIAAEIPRDLANGDYATSFALAAAKKLGRSPRDIAAAVLERLDLEGSCFRSAETAGPGFINFRLRDGWFSDVVAAVRREGADYGRSDDGAGRTVQVVQRLWG